MKVHMTTQMSGSRPDGNRWPQPGTDFEVSDEEGAQLCANGIAVPVAEARAEERKAEKRPEPADPKTETRAEDPPPQEKTPVAEADPAAKRGPGRPRKDG